MGSHTGTHIDAPYHFLRQGRTVDKLPLKSLIGPCRVFEIPGANKITARHIKQLDLDNVTRVLFKTRNSLAWGKSFNKSFTYISSEAAQILVQRKVRLVGVDYLSVEKFGSRDFATHLILLRHGVVILEGLMLKGIKPGGYDLVALPLKIKGGDGSPARAILVQRGRRG